MSVYRLIVFLHVISALLFVMAHGVSAVMMFMLSCERKYENICNYLDISRMMLAPAMRALEGVLVTGIILTIWAKWWMMGWIWASLSLFVAISYVMIRYASGYMNGIRKAMGMVSARDLKKGIRPEPVPMEVLLKKLREGHPRLVASVGLGGLAAIALLMVVKPF